MIYISTVKASQKWNISIRRIAILCKNGRINGAKQIGNRWMIPDNAPKPVDGRTKNAKASGNMDILFRYPAFEAIDIDLIEPPLNDEEIQLKQSMEAFYDCRFEDSINILGDLANTTNNKYIRINALRVSCMASIFNNNGKLFMNSYRKIKEEMQVDFPRKVEMEELVHELEATLGDSSYYSQGFDLKDNYSYHESFIPHLAAISSISLFFSHNKKISKDMLIPYEITCAFLENTNNYVDSQTMHMYLGAVYSLMGLKDKCTWHFKKVFDIAKKHNLYYGVCTNYFYMKKAYEPALNYYSEDFRKYIQDLSDFLHRQYVRFMESMSANSVFKLILSNEYIYILYAALGYKNKEISNILNISERTIAKKYGEIYEMLNVKNKTEMISLYLKQGI